MKVAIFDVDGTLFDNNNRCVHPSTVEAIRRLKEKGVIIVIATGRAFSRLILGVLDFIPDYVVAFSGHALVDHQGNYLYKKAFLPYEVKAIDDFAEENQIPMSYKTGGVRYCNRFMPERFIEKPGELTYVIEEVIYDESKPYLDQEVFFAASRMEESIGHKLTTQLPQLDIYYMHTGWADITHNGMNKAKTMEVLLDHLNLTWQDCIAFGDGLNDIDIIAAAKIGICMGNGYPETKEIADYVCDPIDENGIFNSLVDLKLI